MSNDDYDIARDRLASAGASEEPYREEMWVAIRQSWTEQARRRRRVRVAGWSTAATLAFAAALLGGIYIGRGNAPGLVGPVADLPPSTVGMRGAYRLVLDEHLRTVETLLVQFEAADDDDVREVRALARELASTTRLLADSRAGHDPAVRQMLLDVELLLVQIGRLVDDGDTAERQVVREGLEESSVLPRLRQIVVDAPPALGI